MSKNIYVSLSLYQQRVDEAIFYPISGVETRVEIKLLGLSVIPQCNTCVRSFRQNPSVLTQSTLCGKPVFVIIIMSVYVYNAISEEG